VLIPAGAVEQHGPHLPLGTDAWVAEAVCLGVASADPDVVVGEPLPYGCSWHHTRLPGTITLRTRTFIDLVVDVCRSYAANGYVPLIVNGHGGNRAPLEVALADLAEGGVRGWAVSYFELLAEEVAAEFPAHESAAGHACALETSIVWHLWPQAVREAAIPPGDTPPTWPDPHLFGGAAVRVVRPFDEINPTGVIGRPSVASRRAGARLYESAVRRVADVVARIRAARPAMPADGRMTETVQEPGGTGGTAGTGGGAPDGPGGTGGDGPAGPGGDGPAGPGGTAGTGGTGGTATSEERGWSR
jgi:creatinine amidohydrolase